MTDSLAPDLVPATRNALSLLLLSMADDEFVIGFSDSEWTGIAPMLEEDVAMSSIAQDELGHAQALYRLLAEVVDDGRDADAIAYDRPVEGYYHARLLDHPRGDWADTIARRYLYDTADGIRLDALAESSFAPLRELVAKIRREERYHLMHVSAWLERLASAGGEPRERLLLALDRLAPDAGTVLSPLPNDLSLVMAGIIDSSFDELDARWRVEVGRVFERLGLSMVLPVADPLTARTNHSDAFRWLHGEFTAVRREQPGATW
jgi:ring-1,2-phenylacetyl-CoA epoxidase subunit PaaC